MNDCCDKSLPHQRPRICPPSVVTEDKCAVIDCEYKTVKVTTTTLADCSKTVVIMDGTTVLPPDTKLMSCKEPTPVINVCSETSADVTGADCAGAPITAKGIQTIPHPTAVQLVKLCEPQKDYEVERACNAAGEPVLVQYDAGVVPPTELSRTNMLTGAPEPAGTLRKCDSDEVELVNLVACLNGVEIVGVAVMTDKDLPVMTGELWRDPATGAWGALPAGAVVGKCVERKLHLNSVHWSVAGTPAVTYSAFSFGNYPDLATDFNGTTSTADFYLHAIEHGATGVWGTDGLPFANPTTPVLWANAQTAVDAFLAATGLAAGSILIGNDGAGQPIIWFDTAVISEGDVAWWAGSSTPDNYTNKLKAATAQNFTAPASGKCVEGKAWYDESTGALVRINTLDGVDVTATVLAASLKEGSCPDVCEIGTPVGVVSTWG